MPPKDDKAAKEAGEEAAEEKPEKGKGKGKGKDKAKESKKPPAYTKAKALAQITSLDEDDDEREACSKKISWILRKGASKIGIDFQGSPKDGWIKFSDLVNAEILDDFPDKSEERLMEVIDDSNKQKLRYEMKDGADGKLIRALKKEERKSKSGAEPGAKAGEAKESSLSLTTGPSELRGDAPSFVPASQAAQAASTLAGYSNPAAMGYPGFWNPYGAMAAWGYGGYGYPGYGQSQTDAKGNRRFQGRIKSFNSEKGYGFIESAEAYQTHGRDVFLHKAHIGSFAVGTFISFVVETNKEGMPQARDLAASDGSGAGGKGKGKGKGKKGDGKGKGNKDGEGKGEKKAKGEGKKKAKDKSESPEKDEGEAAAEKPAEPAESAADADKS